MFETSHPEISCKEIMEFPVDTRFLKVPIQNLLKIMGIQLNGPQMWLVNAINSPDIRFITCNYSRRLGKTFASNLVLFCKSLEPDQNLLIVAPDYNLANISFKLQQKFLKMYNLETTRLNQKDRIIEYTNNSIVTIGSESRMDSLSGYTRNLNINDENALCSSGFMSSYEQTLRPSFDAGMNSKQITISTPRGMQSHFREFYDRGFDTTFAMWASASADVDENTRADLADIEEARGTMTRSLFLQEYYVNWRVMSGTIYELDDSCIINDVPEDIEFDSVIMGIDPGFRDEFAAVVLGITEHYVYVIDEYLSSEKSTSIHAEKIAALIEQYDIDLTFVDSANAQVRADFAYDYDIPTNKAKKDVLQGIGFCQSLIEKNRVYVLNKCKHVIEMLVNYRWAPDSTADATQLTKEKPLHDKYSHMADALRYGIYSYKYNLDSILENEGEIDEETSSEVYS